MTTLKCTDCGDDIMFGNDIVHTWQQWQCPVCNQWVDWKEGEFDRVAQPTQPGNPFVTPRSLIPTENLLGFLRWQDDVDKRWDLRDEDGDLHSPVWYLEAWMTTQQAYAEMLAMNMDGERQQVQDDHMKNLDDMLIEVEMYAKYVNRLFGYSGE